MPKENPLAEGKVRCLVKQSVCPIHAEPGQYWSLDDNRNPRNDENRPATTEAVCFDLPEEAFLRIWRVDIYSRSRLIAGVSRAVLGCSSSSAS